MHVDQIHPPPPSPHLHASFPMVAWSVYLSQIYSWFIALCTNVFSDKFAWTDRNGERARRTGRAAWDCLSPRTRRFYAPKCARTAREEEIQDGASNNKSETAGKCSKASLGMGWSHGTRKYHKRKYRERLPGKYDWLFSGKLQVIFDTLSVFLSLRLSLIHWNDLQ